MDHVPPQIAALFNTIEKRFWWSIAAGTIILGLILQNFGLQATPDSLDYLNGSFAFAHFSVDLAPYWPPFYPLLLSLFQFFGLLPAEAACYVNGFAFSAMIAVLFRMSQHFLQSQQIEASKWTWWLLALTPLCWSDLWYVFQVIWSEGLFIGLVMLHLMYLYQYLHQAKQRDLFALLFTASLSILTRHIGYCLLPHITLLLLWQFKKAQIHIPRIAAMIAGTFWPNLIWILYNYQRSGTFYGERSASSTSLQENISLLIEVTGGILLGALGVILLGLITLFLSRPSKSAFQEKPVQTWMVLAILSTLLFYTALLLYSASTVRIDPINPRLTAPIYPLLLILSAFSLHKLPDILGIQKQHTEFGSALILMSVILGNYLLKPERESQTWQRNHEAQSYLNYWGFAHSETARELQKQIAQQLKQQENLPILWVESNRHSDIYKLTGFRSALFGEEVDLLQYQSLPNLMQMQVQSHFQIKTMAIHNSGDARNLPQLQKRIDEVIAQSQQERIVVIGRHFLLRKMELHQAAWQLNDSELVDNRSCQRLEIIKPYALFECVGNPKISAINSTKTTNPQQPKINRSVSSSASPLQETDHILISEVMVLPGKTPKFKGEWIELYNPTDHDIDLIGVEIHSENDPGIFIDESLLIPAQGYALFAMRKSSTSNGGLPVVDFLYKNTELVINKHDWLEIRYQDRIVDHFAIPSNLVSKGQSIMRLDDEFCLGTTVFGDGDLGSPKESNLCP